MCGRTALFIQQQDLEDRFDAQVVTDGGYTPRYNIAPGEPLEVITNETPDEIDQYHWGLIPFWADEPEEGIINARSETAGEKRVFRMRGTHGRAWSSHPDFTNGSNRMVARSSRIVCIARTLQHSRWPASGKCGKVTSRRFPV